MKKLLGVWSKEINNKGKIEDKLKMPQNNNNQIYE